MASKISKAPLHVLMVSHNAQGHINPLLRFANCLASKGLFITFSATNLFGKHIKEANNITDEPIPVGDGFIRFEFFDDEWDWDSKNGMSQDYDAYHLHLQTVGKERVTQMVKKCEEQGSPVSCLINDPFVPWVSDVAERFGIANAVLWVQSCACFAAYYHYHHDLAPFPSEDEPELDVQLPCMPLLKFDEVPDLLHPSSPFACFGRAVLGQFNRLKTPFCILIDTFQELEHEVIGYMSKFCPIKPIGPLFKSATCSGTQVRGDMMKPDDFMGWLDLKPPSSLVYISFGTIAYLKQEQVDEIAHALLNSKVSFLWVMKPPVLGLGHEPHVLPEGFLEAAGDKGKIVQWSLQEQVLAHPSIACFLTHCGWNSTMEALANGVRMLTFPRWGDQVTNAKYSVDVFGVGIRLSRGEADNKIISRDEIEAGLREVTSGTKAGKMKERALMWRRKAEEAMEDGGDSSNNIQSFIDTLFLRGK